MAEAAIVHVHYGIKYLTKEVVSHAWWESSKLFHVEVKLATLQTLNHHGIIYMQLLSIVRLHDAFGQYFFKFNDIRVPLNLLENMRVVHENELLFHVGLIEFLEVRSLDYL